MHGRTTKKQNTPERLTSSLRVCSTEQPLVPEFSHFVSFLCTGSYLNAISGSYYFCKSICTLCYPEDFLQFDGIKKVRGMRCYENLSPSLRIPAKFFSQFKQDTWIQMIFRSFNTKEWMRVWIIQKEQIRKHLQCSVRNVFVQERISTSLPSTVVWTVISCTPGTRLFMTSRIALKTLLCVSRYFLATHWRFSS